MNKKLLLFLLLFIMPFNVKAASLRVSISCGSVQVGGTAVCKVSGTVSGGTASGFSARYSATGSASIQNFSVGAGWQGEGSGGSIDLYTDTNKSGTFAIGTFTVKGNSIGRATISLTGISFFDADFQSVSAGAASTTINVANAPVQTTAVRKTTTTKPYTNKTTKNTIPTTMSTTMPTTTQVPLVLTSLTIGEFKVTYENGVYYANVNEDTEEVNIVATAGQGITIIGAGKRALIPGKNEISIVLRNVAGEAATAKLIITRPEAVAASTKLQNLKVVGYTMNFNPDTLEYTVSVPLKVKEVYLLAETNQDVKITGDGLQVLNKGNNTFYVKVTYADKASTEYTVKITRDYSSIFIMIGITLGLGGIFGFFIYKERKNKDKVASVVAEKNKAIATQQRAIASESQGIEISGEKNNGLTRRVVKPTSIEPVVNNTPAVAQVSINPAPVQVQAKVPVSNERVELQTMAPNAQTAINKPKQVKVVKKVVMQVPKQSISANGNNSINSNINN